MLNSEEGLNYMLIFVRKGIIHHTNEEGSTYTGSNGFKNTCGKLGYMPKVEIEC